MTRTMGMLLVVFAALGASVGCQQSNARVADAFPPAAQASPWVLQGEVWEGPFDAATKALGEDAGAWSVFEPRYVWLGVYAHERQPRRLTVRIVAFPDAERARRAYEHFAPVDAAPFEAGDEGCWTTIGVLFRWDKLVFDIFGNDASWASEVQASLLSGFLTERMPPELPADPR